VPTSEVIFGETGAALDKVRLPIAAPGAEGRKVILRFADCRRDKVSGKTGPL